MGEREEVAWEEGGGVDFGKASCVRAEIEKR